MNTLHTTGQGLTVIKAGTAVVSNAGKTALDMQAISYVGEDIATLNGYEVGRYARQVDCRLNTVLVASGAVTAGIERLGWNRNEVDHNLNLKRVASMVGNAELFAAFEKATGFITATDLPTHNDLDTQESWLHLKGAVDLALDRGLLALFNEGDARSSEELEAILQVGGKEFKRFGDNDWLASHIAVQLNAQTLVFLTSTDGVMRGSKILERLLFHEIDNFITEHVNDLEVSNGGMTSKLLAAKFALEHGVKKVFVGNGKVRHMITQGVTNGWGTEIVH